MAQRQARRKASRGLLITGGIVLLGGLGGCQWCPAPHAGGPAGGASGTTAPAAGSEPAREPATTRQERALMLRQAERGQQAMVRCLQAERSLTEGNELRCENWEVIREEFLGR